MWATFKENPRLILFGFLTAFFSGPGQSFLVSFFLPGIQSDLNLNLAEIGDAYFVATLAGGLALPFLGRLLDRADLTRFSLFMGFCLALGCMLMSIAEAVWSLILGFFFIRCFGPGAMNVISSTVISRNFTKNRGIALSITGQGYPLAEAILPILISYWIVAQGWRSAWVLLAILVVVVFLPSVLYLLGNSQLRAQLKESRRVTKHAGTDKLLSVLLDYRFYLAICSTLSIPCILTGLFLYQTKIAELKGWGLSTMASAFISFAVTRSISGLFVGKLIDWVGARSLIGLVVVPLCLGIFWLIHGDSNLAAYGFLSLTGIAVGAGANIKSAFWAEVYGVRILGSIRGVVAFLTVISTAVAPPLMGRAFLRGFSLEDVLWFAFWFGTSGMLFGLMSSVVYKKKSSRKSLA